jgi:hypothetical protein
VREKARADAKADLVGQRFAVHRRQVECRQVSGVPHRGVRPGLKEGKGRKGRKGRRGGTLEEGTKKKEQTKGRSEGTKGKTERKVKTERKKGRKQKGRTETKRKEGTKGRNERKGGRKDTGLQKELHAGHVAGPRRPVEGSF